MTFVLGPFASEFEFPAFGCFSLIKECAIECVKKTFLETVVHGLDHQGFIRGQYPLSLYKIALFIKGTAVVVDYFFQSWAKRKTALTEEEKLAFLKEHEAEIELMYNTKMPFGKWEHLGTGASKIAFTHEDFPDLLIKIPKGVFGFRGFSGEDDLKIHYANLVDLKKMATSFDRIALPEATLYETSKGSILVEQKFRMVAFHEVQLQHGALEAILQFNKFRSKARLCDVEVEENHNAGVLADKTPITIGIIDFDCRRREPWDR